MNIWDLVAAGVCLCGIVTAYFADTQLHNFVTRNTKLKELGKPMVPNLDRGLWQYSRHPNYFGEQLWWWGLVVFAWNLGHGWTFVGSLINSMCLAYVTVLVEQRMLKQEYRAEAYRLYQKTTSVWVPWFRSSAIAVKDKDTWLFLFHWNKHLMLVVILCCYLFERGKKMVRICGSQREIPLWLWNQVNYFSFCSKSCFHCMTLACACNM